MNSSSGAARTWASGQFVLLLDAAKARDATTLDGFEGGNIYAEVISEFKDGQHFASKRLGPPRYEPCEVRCGFVMGQTLFDWVAGSLGAQPQQKDGVILSLDSEHNILRETAFFGALITEVAFPKLDAGSKEAANLTLRFQPKFVEWRKGAGKLSLPAARPKSWLPSNFRLEIDGLDCSRVSTIDAITIKREVTPVSFRGAVKNLVAGKVEFPNLVCTLSAANASTWFDWHESFLVKGNSGEGFERNGSLRFLANDLKQELGRIELRRIGIVRLAPLKSEDDGQIARVAAELYCEEIVLSRPGGSQ